ELLKQCTAVEPKDGGCFNSLAYLYAEDNIELDKAFTYAQQALEEEPKNGAYLDTMAWVYYRKGLYVEALKEWNEANELIEDYVVYDHMGDVYLAMNRPDEAKKYWRKALELMPEEQVIQDKLNQIDKQSAKKEE